jgi:hypothetical protein
MKRDYLLPETMDSLRYQFLSRDFPLQATTVNEQIIAMMTDNAIFFRICITLQPYNGGHHGRLFAIC